MGAVTFSLDLALVTELTKALPLEVFAETGTFHGDTIDMVRDIFPEIHSVELSTDYYNVTCERFSELTHIELVNGDSATALAKWSLMFGDRSALYFLDAHWCVAENSAGKASQCPLLSELKAINRINEHSLIVIDDARLFLAPPPAPHEISHWPSFDEISKQLASMSCSHKTMVVNDCIVFFPPSVEMVLQNYAYNHGVDWLAAMSKVRDYDNLRSQFNQGLVHLEAKEKMIQHLKSICDEREALIKRLSR